MSDHEFEKQVYQKLQELKLRPSDSVWMEVEKNIRQDQHRRRFMWWWMAALFICVTAGGYIMYRNTAQTHFTNDIVQATPASLSNTIPAETSTSTAKQSTSSQPVTDKTTTTSQNNNANASPNDQPQPTVEAPVAIIAETTSPQATKANKQPTIVPAENNVLTKTTIKRNNKPVKQPAFYTDGNTNPHIAINDTKFTYEKQRSRKMKGVTETLVVTTPAQREEGRTIEPSQEELNVLNSTMPARVNNLDSAIATNKATATPINNKWFLFLMPDSLSNKTVAAQPLVRKKPSLWHWGVMVDAGYSRIAKSKLFQLKGLLGTEKYLAEDLSARSNAIYSASPSPSNGTNGFNSSPNNQMVNWQAYAAPPKKASPIQPDVSFSVGMFVQRALTPRLKLSLGMEYSYLSVHTQVGQKVNAPNNPIVVNMGTSQAALVTEYYKYPGTDTAQTISGAAYYQGATSSQKYTYRFHYLEIPLTASWQINKGRKLPPFQLEAGISLARLLSVDALHYEGLKGVYYKDNDLFNKTQFNFVTGLSIGLLQKSKHPIWIGPNLRYALNGLVDKEVSTGQYSWSTGVSVKILLGKL